MVSKRKNEILVYAYKFDTKKISEALKISEETAGKEFKDGRVISRFSEFWGSVIYNYNKHTDTNYIGSDGNIKLGNLGDVGISVKTLSNSGLKIQKSVDTHNGKTCGVKELLSACRTCEYYLIVDSTEFPYVQFVTVPTQLFVQWVMDGTITKTGVKKKKFYELLKGIYDEIKIVVLDDEGIAPKNNI